MKLPALPAAIRIACLAGALAAPFATSSLAAPGAEGHATPAQDLSLSGLEQRVRDTHAISVFQKLALQKEVDDLLAKFRQAHAGGSAELAKLRRPYDRLLGNLQSQLERDPQLANEISASREAIWEVLSDRTRFASL